MAMKAAHLQRLYTPPRRDRFNKSNLNSNSQTSDGLQDNGILYKLIDQRDYQTYRVLSDDQVIQEYQQTTKLARSISANSLKSSRKSFDFQPPMFGVVSKSAKMKKKAWDNQIKQSTENGSEPQNDTIKALLSNTKKNSSSLDNEETDENNNNESKIPSDFNLISAVNLMKSKYIENIKVIEKLYNEKIEMEEKLNAMEKQLQLSQSFSTKHIDDNSNIDLNNRENVDSNLTSTNKLTANEIADLIIEKSFDFKPNKDANYNNEESTNKRSRSANGRLNGNTSRSYSVSPGRFQISPRLQADYDNYLYKQKLIKQKEINDKLLKEQYELEKAERLKNISANSPEFQSMINRQKLYEEKKNLKLSEIKQNQIIKSENENLEKLRKHYENLERLSKPTIKHDIDWKEYAALEDNKRKQRIEERKQALSMSLTNNDFHYMTANKSTVLIPEYYKPFKAKDDPDKIIEKLQKQQQLWDNKLSKTKENIRQSLSLRNTTLQSESTQSIVQSMENRRQYYEMKRKLFNDEKLKKEQLKLEEKKLNEKLKFEKLINSKIHEKSTELSGASLIRAKFIKEKSDKEKIEEEKKKTLEQQKMKSARETAAVVKTIIEQSEYERKLKVPSYIELRDVDSIAAEKAAQKRKEMREKLRKQKQDLEDGKRKQPSLIERHEQKIAKDSGYVKALDKINNTIDNKSNKAINNVFDEKEKLFLGLE